MAIINCISSAGVAKPGQRRRSVLFIGRSIDGGTVRCLERKKERKKERVKVAGRRLQSSFPTTLFLRDSWVQIPPPALESYNGIVLSEI